MNELEFDILVGIAALLAGLIGSLIGLGGGIIITPILVLGFGIDIRYAMGASLVSVIATSSGAAAAYVRDGVSNMRIGVFLCVATTLGAVVGALSAAWLPANILSIVFGGALLVSIAFSFLKHDGSGAASKEGDPLARILGLNGEYPTANGKEKYQVFGVVPGFVVMILAGVLSGLLGIGSGAFKVLAMDQIMRIPFKVTTATSNFMIGVTAAASVGIYLRHGYLDPPLVFPVVIGVLVGSFFGAKLLPIAPVSLLKAIFLTAVFAIAIQMILRGFGIQF